MTTIFGKNGRETKLVLAYKDFSKTPGVTHAGLGVTALNLGKALGPRAHIWPVFDGYVLRNRLRQEPATHICMLAPWVDTPFLRELTAEFPRTQFTVTFHSNVGFLQVDPWSSKLLAEHVELQADRRNFRLSVNCHALAEFVRQGYGAPAMLLPNLYDTSIFQTPRPRWRGDKLRVGLFGATRVLKNMGTGVAACAVLAHRLHTDVEVCVNAKREEGGQGVLSACEAIASGQHRLRITRVDWQGWPRFMHTLRSMDVNLQPSFTESFNNVTADSIAAGVAVTVSPAVGWVPNSWKANPDDAVALADVAQRLIGQRRAAAAGQRALKTYVAKSMRHWDSWLGACL